MATYKGIKGYKVQSHASDPTANEGQIWYNTASYALKYDQVGAGAWASGNNLNTAHGQMGIVGGPPAALCFGGISTDKNTCESFDGSTWSVANTLNQGRSYNAGWGSTTAAVTVGGNPQAITATETWNGTSWSAVPGVLSAGRQKFGTANNGTTTAGLIFGGQNSPGPPWYSLALVESWNGSSWSVETAVTTDREAGGGVGIGTAALWISGYDQNPPSGNRANVEEWNGSSWAEETDVNTARQSVCCSGTTTSALLGGGAASPKAYTEQWNGTSWTEVADLGTGREGMGKGAGASGNACIGAGADAPAPTAILTELWDGAPATVKTVTVS